MMRKYLYIALAFFAIACNHKDPNAERRDYIRVYESRDGGTPIDRSTVSVKGGSFTYYVKSNVEFTAKWQSEDVSWASISEPRKIEDGLWSIEVTVQPVASRSLSSAGAAPTGLYSRRYGVLMLSAPARFLGRYFVIEQGLESRMSQNFSWLHGAEDPNDSFSDLPMSRWTASQRNQGFTSTVLPDQEDAWVYSKEGYVKLGNDNGVGADLITPHTADFQYDTLLVLSFKAVAQNGESLPDYTGGTEPIVPMHAGRHPRRIDGETENAFMVEVTGGGCIRDFSAEGRTSLDLELSTYDRESAGFPANMFDDGSYLIFIEGTDSNPITVNTAIRFVSKGRMFIDDIFIYRVDRLLDEDLFALNGGKSGRDIIKGGAQ